jgi:hypothetical protein
MLPGLVTCTTPSLHNSVIQCPTIRNIRNHSTTTVYDKHAEPQMVYICLRFSAVQVLLQENESLFSGSFRTNSPPGTPPLGCTVTASEVCNHSFSCTIQHVLPLFTKSNAHKHSKQVLVYILHIIHVCVCTHAHVSRCVVGVCVYISLIPVVYCKPNTKTPEKKINPYSCQYVQ